MYHHLPRPTETPTETNRNKFGRFFKVAASLYACSTYLLHEYLRSSSSLLQYIKSRHWQGKEVWVTVINQTNKMHKKTDKQKAQKEALHLSLLQGHN